MLCDDRGNILRSVTWFLFSQTYQSLLFLVRCQIHNEKVSSRHRACEDPRGRRNSSTRVQGHARVL